MQWSDEVAQQAVNISNIWLTCEYWAADRTETSSHINTVINTKSGDSKKNLVHISNWNHIQRIIRVVKKPKLFLIRDLSSRHIRDVGFELNSV